MKVIKVHDVHVPHHMREQEFVRWVELPEIPSVIDGDDDVESCLVEYKECRGRIRKLRRWYSENHCAIIVDDESDIDQILDFFNDVYNLALADIAESIGTETHHLKSRVQEYFYYKLMKTQSDKKLMTKIREDSALEKFNRSRRP